MKLPLSGVCISDRPLDSLSYLDFNKFFGGIMMKKIIALILALILMALATSCNNPNASPVDKKGGYHTSSVYIK